MRNLLFITMLLGIGYSQCNESNWQEYYPNMEYCDLAYANLAGAELGWANLYGANLSWANLYQADLDTADFAGAQCYAAFFVYAI